jgi:hypothetical protein
MAFNAHQFVVDLFTGLSQQDRAGVEKLVHSDFVSTLPQSGEQSRGFDQFWAQFVNYPGSAPVPSIPEIRVLGDDERWAMSPGYTVVPLTSPDDYTVILRAQYPDGTWWHNVVLVQIRDGQLYRMDSYFAPEMRAPLAESIAAYQHG